MVCLIQLSLRVEAVVFQISLTSEWPHCRDQALSICVTRNCDVGISQTAVPAVDLKGQRHGTAEASGTISSAEASQSICIMCHMFMMGVNFCRQSPGMAPGRMGGRLVRIHPGGVSPALVEHWTTIPDGGPLLHQRCAGRLFLLLVLSLSEVAMAPG